MKNLSFHSAVHRLSFIVCGLCIGSPSCSDMLELQNDGRISMEEIFTTRDGVRGYLNACYAYRPAPSYDKASLCDEAHNSDGTVANSLYSFWYGNTLTASSYTNTDGAPWDGYYAGIRKCNIFLANMANVTTNTIYASEGELTGWTAQAHTLRAFYYLQLIRRYGAVPILTEAYAAMHNYGGDRRSAFSEVVRRILDDCDAALAAPDVERGFSWEVLNGQSGIMTRAVAYAIKSQAITYAASPLWDDGTYTWADATRINKEALSQCLANGYRLFDHVPEAGAAQIAYDLYFITRPDEQRAYDKETIYGGTVVSVWQNDGMPSTDGQIKAGACPTQELVDSYEMLATGEPPITGYTDAQHLNPVINASSGYDADKPYEGRDPRFYASIYYNGAIRQLGTPGLGRDDHFPLTPHTSPEPYHHLIVTEAVPGEYHMAATNEGDPYFYTTPMGTSLNAGSGSVYFRMEYKAPVKFEKVQFFFGKPDAYGGWATVNPIVIEASADWTAWQFDITSFAKSFEWGEAAHALRLDFDGGADGAGKEIDIRKMEVVVQTTLDPVNPVASHVGGADGITVTDRRTTHTGYYLRKYNNWKSGSDNSADGAVRLFRLAELYLNFAESTYRSDGPDAVIDMGNGMSMSARDAVNAVRARVGMPEFPAGMSKEAFEKKYRNERRVELAFEEHRYFDVRRWKILPETERYLTGMNITPSGASFNYARIGFERGSWANQYYLYAVPQSEVNKMQEHTGTNWQNEGWN
ncbi:MAG: RagB/SusD family nutrient uptake outer membrane protein [Bacteroidales bacterium]|nr:RagB/SusD family nutrient uptake outer membrane protein [Bacteroidales bacterium]